MADGIRFYAFFLPQFHECSFNNAWWGKGFTEWDNVRRSRPRFEGHLQPRVPAGGFFDLSDPEEIASQYALARGHGVDGFVFYHYWYQGQRPLGKPLDLVLANPDLELSFSLCWANHSWTRSWKNRAGALDVLIEQGYERSREELERHYRFLNRAFADPRYITLEGRPLFQLYAPEQVPNLVQYLEGLREFTLGELGVEPHLSALVTGWRPAWDYLSRFDSATFSQPALALYAPANVFSTGLRGLCDRRFFSGSLRALPLPVRKVLCRVQDLLLNRIDFFDYGATWNRALEQSALALESGFRVFPSAFVDFDNSPRYGERAKIIRGFEPARFGAALEALVSLAARGGRGGETPVFINAWNEWGEGMYLQPDNFFGNARLEELRRVKLRLPGTAPCGAAERAGGV